MKYFISRQQYYYSHLDIVEIAIGGLNLSGADMLVAHYENLGEGNEFTDPREAVEAAIAIARAWRKDEPKKKIVIGYGSTGGMGMELEACSFKAAQKWAEETYEKAEKCDRCNELLPENYFLDEFREYKFCSEHCAERWAEDQTIEQAKFEEEEKAHG